jgi:hypothetical protein
VRIGSITMFGLALLAWQNSLSQVSFAEAMSACTMDDDGATLSLSESGRGSSGPGQMADTASTDAAFDFLNNQMDRYHRSTIIYAGPEFSAYYPSGRMGDVEDISIDGSYFHSGNAALKLDYRPRRFGGSGWSGLYFLYPDGNWGQIRGRDLTGATKLSFRACSDHETWAEFFVGGIQDPQLPHGDSLKRISTGVVAINSTWQSYEIDLKGRDLSSVIGGFALTLIRDQNPGSRSLYLKNISVDLPKLSEPRLLQSYVPNDCPQSGPHNGAQLYDQALVLLAYLARGRPDDVRRAELIARALVEAQQNDRTFKDGRLRNAYASGELIDLQSGTIRIPGEYDSEAQRYFEDENAVGSDTGNMAWAALALAQAHVLLPKRAGDSYLNAALSLARWIVSNARVDDSLGGFSAGLQGFERAAGVAKGQERKAYRSTEHNIDLEALFARLAAVVGSETAEGQYWSMQAANAHSFVERMRNERADATYFWTGTDAGTTINTKVIPLDVQTWAVLRTREPARYSRALDWALNNCGAIGSSDTFDFNCKDGDGVWWEGTAQVVAALRWLKRDQEAAPALARLRAAQLQSAKTRGALPAASICGLTPGFDVTYRSGKTMPWIYPNRPHIGATAWFIFAELGVNPYFVGGTAGPR